jgi:hypothetical protein
MLRKALEIWIFSKGAADMARVPMSAATGPRSPFAFRLLARLCFSSPIFPRLSHLK